MRPNLSFPKADHMKTWNLLKRELRQSQTGHILSQVREHCSNICNVLFLHCDLQKALNLQLHKDTVQKSQSVIPLLLWVLFLG